MHTYINTPSVGEISKKAIIERAEKRLKAANQVFPERIIDFELIKEIGREKKKVFKEVAATSPGSLLGRIVTDTPAQLALYLIIMLWLVWGNNDSVLALFITTGFGVTVLLLLYGIFSSNIESAFKSGAASDWYRYEQEYRKTIDELQERRLSMARQKRDQRSVNDS